VGQLCRGEAHVVLGCRGGGEEGASQLELRRELRRAGAAGGPYCTTVVDAWQLFIRHYVVDLDIPVVLRLYRRLALWILSFLPSSPA